MTDCNLNPVSKPPVALLTRLGPDDRDPNGGLRVRYCSACYVFHPAHCFHRDRTQKSGYRYQCRMTRRETRPSEAKPCPTCGGKRGRWHARYCSGAAPLTAKDKRRKEKADG